MSIDRIRVGDQITADFLNQLVDAANGSPLKVAQGGGLDLKAGPEGSVLSTTIALPFWAKITGPLSSGKYPFTQQYPTTSGGWTNAPSTGTAYEVTGNTSVATNTIVKMTRTSSGDYRFFCGTC